MWAQILCSRSRLDMVLAMSMRGILAVVLHPAAALHARFCDGANVSVACCWRLGLPRLHMHLLLGRISPAMQSEKNGGMWSLLVYAEGLIMLHSR